MVSIIDRLKSKRDISNTILLPLEEVSLRMDIEKVNFTDILNSKVEDFITFVLLKNDLYVLGFMGMTCIARKVEVNVEDPTWTGSVAFSVSRNILKSLNSREELNLELNKGKATWTFKYGEGYIAKTMKVSNTIYDVRKYLDFIINSDIANIEGTVDASSLKMMRKAISAVTKDPMEKNIVIGKGYIYAILPTFAIFEKSNTDTSVVLTENILSNLPKRTNELKVTEYKGFSGLMSMETGIYYIFKSLVVDDMITRYVDLPINWIGSMDDKIAKAIGVISFGEDIELELKFDARTQTVLVSEVGNDDSQYIGKSKVEQGGSLYLDSLVKDFPRMSRVGKVAETGKEHIKVISLEGRQICMIR